MQSRPTLGPCGPSALNDVDPQAWLADVLAKLPDHPAKQIDEMLPWTWKVARTAETLAKAA